MIMQCEWYTPHNIIDLAREVLGVINVDPASNEIAQEWIKADTFYTEDINGLDKPWNGKVWVNPPYSAALIKKFTNKFISEYENGNMIEGIMLTNSGTDTIWNKPLQKGLQAYTNGRISFLQPDLTEKGKGSRGSLFTYLGPNPKKFIEVFTREDFCWIPNQHLITLN